MHVQGKAGWDIAKALASAQAIAKSAGDEAGQKAAAAVQKVFKKVRLCCTKAHSMIASRWTGGKLVQLQTAMHTCRCLIEHAAARLEVHTPRQQGS